MKKFKSIEEALFALRMDRLGTVFIRSKVVFIATNQGTGEFSKEEYDKVMGKKGES